MKCRFRSKSNISDPDQSSTVDFDEDIDEETDCLENVELSENNEDLLKTVENQKQKIENLEETIVGLKLIIAEKFIDTCNTQTPTNPNPSMNQPASYALITAQSDKAHQSNIPTLPIPPHLPHLTAYHLLDHPITSS